MRRITKKTICLLLTVAMTSMCMACGSNGANDQGVSSEELQLTLPEEYSIKYTIHEESVVDRTFEQEITKTEDAIYISLGETGEGLVFEKADDGNYIQYQYNVDTDTFDQVKDATGIAKIEQSIVEKYIDLATIYCNFYDQVEEKLTYVEQEKIGDVLCNKYVTEVETALTETTTEIWVDANMGLCMKIVYNFEPEVGVSVKRTVECEVIDLTEVELPDYKTK